MLKKRKVHALIEHHAIINSSNIALRLGADELTYDQFNMKANQLANYLMQMGVQPGDKVPIVIEKSIAAQIARLALLKLGAIFISLNETIPLNTLESIINDIQATHVLTTQSIACKFKKSGVQFIELENGILLSEKQDSHNLGDLPNSSDDAYLIYTSGTTGKPKAVIVSHHNLLQTWYSWEQAYQLTSNDRHLQMANSGFDVEIGDSIRALCSGAALIICPKDILIQPRRLIALLQDEKISCAEFVPAVLRQVLSVLSEENINLSFLRLLVCGSDQWTMGEYRATRKIIPATSRLINSYGMSEATIDSTYFEADIDALDYPDGELVPVGKSKSFLHCEVYVLNEQLQLVGDNEVGELFIAGAGVTAGYFNLPEINKERFIPNPFTEKGDKLYRTGDQGKYLPDGNIAFLGRNQMHIKINGKRIDLVSLEFTLSQYPNVHQAFVIPHTINSSLVFLKAVLITSAHFNGTYEDIKAYLKSHLPDVHVINELFISNRIQLTNNGKIDRPAIFAQALMKLEPIKIRPVTPLESQIMQIWQEVTGYNDISMDSNFVEAGGSSLSYQLLLERMNKAFNLSLRANCQLQTPQQFVKVVDKILEINHCFTLFGKTNPAEVSRMTEDSPFFAGCP